MASRATRLNPGPLDDMNVWAIIAAFAVVVGLGSLSLMNKLLTMMIAEINRRRSDNDQLSYFGFTPHKYVMIFTEYARLVPAGKLHRWYMVATVVTGVALVGAWLLLMFLGTMPDRYLQGR